VRWRVPWCSDGAPLVAILVPSEPGVALHDPLVDPALDFGFEPSDRARPDLDRSRKTPSPHLGIQPRMAVTDLFLDFAAAQDAALLG
jgi:hypothetical protein